jgi:hypothetical protein
MVDMDDRHAKRIAINESRFRDLNDRLAENIRAFREGLGTDEFAAVCECAVSECEEMVPLTFGDYEHVRSNPRWYAVRPDHIIPSVEHPVERRDGYWIIEKDGIGGEVADELAARRNAKANGNRDATP